MVKDENRASSFCKSLRESDQMSTKLKKPLQSRYMWIYLNFHVYTLYLPSRDLENKEEVLPDVLVVQNLDNRSTLSDFRLKAMEYLNSTAACVLLDQ